MRERDLKSFKLRERIPGRQYALLGKMLPLVVADVPGVRLLIINVLYGVLEQ